MSHKSNGRPAEVRTMLAKKAGSESVFPDAETGRIHGALTTLAVSQEVWTPGERPELGRLDAAAVLANNWMTEILCPGLRSPVLEKATGSLFTVILQDCELLTRGFGWVFGEVITFSFLFRTPAGHFVEYDVNVDDTTLELKSGIPVLITGDEAARWYLLNPETAPKYLMPALHKFDLSKAPADGPDLVAAAPSGNATAATNGRNTEAVGELPDPAAPEMSPAWNDLQQAAFTSLHFVRAAERLKRSLEGSDEDAIFVECASYCKYASDLDALFARKDWERHTDLTVGALRLGHTLDARWLILKRRSGLAEFDMMSLIDVSTTEYNPDDPFPFWVGHELTYRRFYENALELLEALGQPVKDPGPIPFLDTLAPSYIDPAGPQTNGQPAPPPAEPPELVAAGPRVILGEFGGNPIVNGKIKKRLLLTQFHVMEALMEAGTNGLSKDELVNKSGHSDAVNILKRLRDSDPDWKSVILTGEIPGGRYRVSV